MTLIRPTQRMASFLLGLALQSLLSEVFASDDAKAVSAEDSLKALLGEMNDKLYRSVGSSVVPIADEVLLDMVPHFYSSSAVIQVSGGSILPVFYEARKQVASFPNFHGDKEIRTYFLALQKAIRKVGCTDVGVTCSPSGVLEGDGKKDDSSEARIFVVSDTEAVIAGKLSYSLDHSIVLECQILSETWRRGSLDEPWKIRSAMYSWNVSNMAALDEIFQVPANAAAIGESPAPAAIDINGTMVAAALTKLEDVREGHSSTFLIIVLVIGTIGGLLEWRRRRKAAQWSSINTGGDVWLG